MSLYNLVSVPVLNLQAKGRWSTVTKLCYSNNGRIQYHQISVKIHPVLDLDLQAMLALINKLEGMLKYIALLRGGAGLPAFVPSHHMFPVVVVSALKRNKKDRKHESSLSFSSEWWGVGCICVAHARLKKRVVWFLQDSLLLLSMRNPHAKVCMIKASLLATLALTAYERVQ